MEAISSALYFSPMPLKCSTAWSRGHTSRRVGMAALMISRIFSSIFGRSSGVKGVSRAKS